MAPTHSSACSRHSWPLPRGNSNEGSYESPLLKNAFPITPTLVTRMANRPASRIAPLFVMSITANAGDDASTSASAKPGSRRSKLFRASIRLPRDSLHAARGRLEPQHHPARSARLEHDAERIGATAEEHHLRRVRLGARRRPPAAERGVVPLVAPCELHQRRVRHLLLRRVAVA